MKAPCSGPISAYHFKQEIEVKYAVLILLEVHCRIVESSFQRPSDMELILEGAKSPRTETHARALKMYGETKYSFWLFIMDASCETKEDTPQTLGVKKPLSRNRHTQHVAPVGGRTACLPVRQKCENI
jgi:hypothetical protein